MIADHSFSFDTCQPSLSLDDLKPFLAQCEQRYLLLHKGEKIELLSEPHVRGRRTSSCNPFSADRHHSSSLFIRPLLRS